MPRRIALPLFAFCVLGLVLTAAALAAGGDLTQKAGTAGCVSDDGSSDGTIATAGQCADGRNLLDARSVVVSPDGKNVYVANAKDTQRAIDVFDRDPATGAVTQKAGTAGCIQESPSTDVGCDNTGFGLRRVNDLVISPDGRN